MRWIPIAVAILVGVAIYSTHRCEQRQVTAMPWVKVCTEEKGS